MNHLRRIVFVNSAYLPYLEIETGDQLLITGENDSGKSTLLRAIRFFYLAHPNEVGIQAQQQPFVQFYFPYANSYLIYEVQGVAGVYTLFCFQKKGSIRFLFIGGSFDAELLINKKKTLLPDELLKRAKKSSKTALLEDASLYHDILLGSIKGKKAPQFRPFAICKSSAGPQAFNLAREVSTSHPSRQSYIRQTLLACIPSLPTEIDLSSIQQQIKEIATYVREIDQLENHLPLIQQIIHQHQLQESLQGQMEEEKAILLVAHAACSRQITQIQAGQLDQQTQLEKLEQQFQQREKDWTDRREKLWKQLGTLEHHLQAGQEKQASYAKRGIDSLYARLQQMDLLLDAETDDHRLQLQTTQAHVIQQLEQVRVKSEQAQEELTETYRQASKQLEEEISSLEAAYQQLEQAQAVVRVKEADPVLIRALQTQILQLKQSSLEILSKKERAEYRLEHAIQKRDQELQEIRLDLEKQKNEFDMQSDALSQQTQRIDERISASERAFYGWLEKNYPDWQQSIGKVITEEVLFHPFLAPHIEKINELLFGIQIDISELEGEAQTIEALQKKRDLLEEELVQQQKKWVNTQAEAQQQLQQCEKRNRLKIRELRKAITNGDQQLEKLEIEIKQKEVRKKELHIQQAQVREKESLQLAYKIAEQQQKIQAVRHQRDQLDEELARKIQEEKRQFVQTNTSIREQHAANHLELPTIAFPEKAIQTLKKEFPDVEQLLPSITAYQRDKQVYLDLLATTQADIQRIKNLLEKEKNSFLQAKEAYAQAAEDILHIQQENQRKLEQLQVQEDAFHAFQQSETFLQIKNISPPTEIADSLDTLALIHAIQAKVYEQSAVKAQIQQLIIQFNQHISQNNRWGLAVHLPKQEDYAQYIQQLISLVQENRIAEHKTDAGIQYAQLIRNIAESTSEVLAIPSQIPHLLEKLNIYLDSFTSSGPIRNMKWEMEERMHPLVRMLQEIQQFNLKSGHKLGGVSLFNQGSSADENQQAIRLLSQLNSELEKYASTTLNWEDTFEVSFQYETNRSLERENAAIDLPVSKGVQLWMSCIRSLAQLALLRTHTSDPSHPLFIPLLLDQADRLDIQRLQQLLQFSTQQAIPVGLVHTHPVLQHLFTDVYLLHAEETQLFSRAKLLKPDQNG